MQSVRWVELDSAVRVADSSDDDVEVKHVLSCLQKLTILVVMDLGSFKVALQNEKIFCDYLNTFLNLPVFAKRLTYNVNNKSFEIEPSIDFTHNIVDASNLVTWVYQNRMPLFWCSDIFHEYQLCKALSYNNEVVPDGKEHWLDNVSAMSRLRKYLFHTEGEAACMFWIDMQRLRQSSLSNDKWNCRRLMIRITQTYLQDGALFAINEDIRDGVLCCFERQGNVSVTTKQKMAALIQAQGRILDTLRVYWCRVYITALQNETRDKGSDLRKSISSLGEHDRQNKKIKSQVHFPRIITDEGKLGSELQARKASHINLTSTSHKFPELACGHSSRNWPSVLTQAVSNETISKISIEARGTPDLLITPSSQALFKTSATSTCNDIQPTVSAACTDRRFNLDPFLTASLRSDFLSGNPILRYLKKVKPNPKAINCLLFWHSVENILTQDEMRRWYGRWSQRTGSDRLCPYLSYYETYPVARDLKDVVRLFIKPCAPHKVEMPREWREELAKLLPRGLGQSLLLTAQDAAAKYLITFWQDYLLYDYNQFVTKCVSQKSLSRFSSLHRRDRSKMTVSSLPAPHLIVEKTFGSSHLQCMWSSLRYAESMKYQGISQLPSRRLTDVSLFSLSTSSEEVSTMRADDVIHGSDSAGDESGLSLSPMTTTIYNKILCDWRRSRIQQKTICTTKPAHSSDFYKKPPIPKRFLEILKDREQLEFFRHFLFMHGIVSAEMPLQFWLAIEDIKNSMNNKKDCNRKIRKLQRTYLVGDTDRTLMCQDPTIYELSKYEKPSLFQLLAAQMAITAMMEKKWFESYVEHLSSSEEKEAEKEDIQIKIIKENTKGLWSMFTHNVISFKRGLMNNSTAEMFRRFLHKEVIQSNESSGRKKLIGTRVINVSKLLNDLSFWVEVERYKDLADTVRLGQEIGTHTPEDDITVHKKAHALINCYIDSAVYPRIQINVPNDLVGHILDNISQGIITRGLFHEAALNIFSVLILYWKKFCMYRFAPKRKGLELEKDKDEGSKSTADCSNWVPRTTDWQHNFIDGGPILSYSLSFGLRWLYPGQFNHGTSELPQQQEIGTT